MKTGKIEIVKLGIDLGSSTAKIVLLNDREKLQYKTYRRHNGRVKETLLTFLSELPDKFRNEKFKIIMTGSAGMGLASRIEIPFTQEVIALTKAIRKLYPEVSTFIELGGEDAKIVLFGKNSAPEMRMNGSCAGGTGSFIDQMATLLNVDLPTLNQVSKSATKKLYVASRCGVFAKTDVQALLNKGENKSDIARSVFMAVANQTITTLLAGAEVKSKVLFAGGPLTFLSELRKAFVEALDLPETNFILPENSEVLVAVGAALLSVEKGRSLTYDQFLAALKNEKKGVLTIRTLDPLFKNETEYKKFKKRHAKFNIRRLSGDEIKNVKEMYLGVDAGSTTTKLILIDEKNNIIDEYYSNNHGTPLDVAVKALKKFKKYFKEYRLKAAYATGYGEEFVRVALNLDGGIVETMAHFTAGSLFNDKLSFIVDVGGQDIKSIKIDNGIVADIQLNEACSSGTGSFIETFAGNLNLSLNAFVNEAVFAENPVDLGTRCSVFMNSKVKEALKDGVAVDDIAAGLAYSVVKNALYKVIKIKNIEELGENIFVQGGTFKNDAVLRAFELLTGKNVVRLNISEYMGAFGAALYAKDFCKRHPDYQTQFNIKVIDDLEFRRKIFHCQGCGFFCEITQSKFPNGNKFYTGHRCDKFFSNKPVTDRIKENFFRDKEEILFNVDKYIPKEALPEIDPRKPVIGIPRVLSVYEHYPFFYSFFRKLGFEVVLSDNTTKKMYYKGLRTVTADSLCLPAKVANGHILNLIDKKVDRIFYPSIVFEAKVGKDAKSAYNCPIVTGYGEVLKRNIKSDIPIDSFPMSFTYMPGVKHNAYEYLKEYGVSRSEVNKAIEFAMGIEKKSIDLRRALAKNIINKARADNKPLIIVLGRPYHLDPMINTGIMDLIYDLGAYAISEDAIPNLNEMNLEGVLPLTQWSYHNRLYLAAKWIMQHDYNKCAALQLNSFGCGPDAVVGDEVKTLVETAGKIYISIKIDEMSNLGSAKIRIRSLLEALDQNKSLKIRKRNYTKTYSKSDKRKTVLVPYFAEIYSDLLEPVFYRLGYKIETLYEQSKEAVDEGLKYVNNDMCYPAVVVIGDLIKALKSGKYDPHETVVALSQTNGQCRASNYVPLLKKALIDAGFLSTPVISLSADSFAEGFRFNPVKFIKYSVILFTMADGLMRMKLKTKPFEINKGETVKLVNRLTKELQEKVYLEAPSRQMLRQFMRYAVNEFNKIEVTDKKIKKKVGIVGEIYVKNNGFSNNYLVDWLENRGYEVVLPSYTKFFEYGYYSQLYSTKEKISHRQVKLATRAINHFTIDHYRKLVEEELRRFARYEKEVLIGEALKAKDEPLPPYLQFGEGWLLPLEISEMVKGGVKNVISLQPFGCISNHIVARGVYRQLKDKYDANLLMLDYESGMSEVNTANRLELFLSNN
jgi:predicted CoA-substrate-specific enzyme activase